MKTKYVKLEDVRALLNKLNSEPAYQHEDEDFYSGVCAVECELDSLYTIELVESAFEAEWVPTYEGFLGTDYQCSNCGDLADEGNSGHHNVLTEFCPHCGCKMRVKED